METEKIKLEQELEDKDTEEIKAEILEQLVSLRKSLLTLSEVDKSEKEMLSRLLTYADFVKKYSHQSFQILFRFINYYLKLSVSHKRKGRQELKEILEKIEEESNVGLFARLRKGDLPI